MAVKEKSCKESQKAYAKEQSTVKNLQKELATIEVSCTITHIINIILLTQGSMEKLNFNEDKRKELELKRLMIK